VTAAAIVNRGHALLPVFR